MAKNKKKSKAKDIFDRIRKPTAPPEQVMVDRKEKRKRKFDFRDSLKEYQRETDKNLAPFSFINNTNHNFALALENINGDYR